MGIKRLQTKKVKNPTGRKQACNIKLGEGFGAPFFTRCTTHLVIKG